MIDAQCALFDIYAICIWMIVQPKSLIQFLFVQRMQDNKEGHGVCWWSAYNY